MPNPTSDDDRRSTVPAPPEPDAHGQAAYLLLESLIHRLIAESVITIAAAIEVVEVACEVKFEIAGELGDSPGTMIRSLGILKLLSTSLHADMPAERRSVDP